MQKKYLAFLLLILSSCSLFDREEPAPKYVQIEEIFYIDSLTKLKESPNTHNFKTAWVYIDEQLQGVYELPVRFPVLQNGVHEIKVSPGITANGISSIREIYPHSIPFKQSIDFDQQEILVSPSSAYPAFSKFLFNEDFENLTLSFDTNVNSKVALQRFENIGLKGRYCGGAILKDSLNRLEIETTSRYSIPKSSNPVFLEMNYLSDVTLLIGFFVYNADQSISRIVKLGVNPRPEWNKIYVKLTTELLSLNANQQFGIFVNAINESPTDSARVYIDELKLLY